MTDLSGKSIKGYQLQARLGEGAFGAVYRATQPHVKREVAIKIILPEYANRPDFIRRFEAEAQLVAQLEHMHIVPLYDYWREPRGAYLVMRLMKGGSLEASLRENGPWEPPEAARLVDQIASALEAAHKQGVVHRDLKPANILLDEDGNAYLSDFGIAKEIGTDASTTQTGAIMGTPAYITPEQVQSQPVSAQTDIYSLGVVLYELLVGVHPFPDTPTGELVVKHLNEPLPYVREVRPELPAAVDGVIQRATSKDPGSRYPDALSLATDLRSALDMEAALPEIPEEEITNPYKGLRAFQEADADDFYGRDALIGQLLASLIPTPTPSLPPPGGGTEGGGQNRFLAVVGPSGSGKSSAVKAGLVPALRKGALPGSDEWFITEMVPGAHPLEELERTLMGIATNPNLNLQEQLAKDSFGLLRAAWMALPGNESELLLVIDQFEELFILVEDESEREHFLNVLHTAVTDKESIVRVVVTLRADFYDRPLMYPEFGQLVEVHTAIVLPLSTEELEQAIRSPSERVGAVLEKGLVGAITADVAEQPGTLPLLQYALTELFERREGRMLTGDAYLSIGGVLGALGRRAEEVYSDLDKSGKEVTRQLFLRLVTLGEGVEDTRRRVLRTELEGLIGERGEDSAINNQKSTISNVIDAFGGARLLTFDRDPVTREPTVEVAHEALLQEWRRLREWLDESRADIRMQRVLGNAANEWLEAGRDAGFLLRGSRLEQFEGWLAGTDLALTADEQAFMEASLEERKEREAAEADRQAREAKMERRSRNFLRGLVIVLAVAVVVAMALSAFAIDRGNDSQNSAATARAEALARATQQKVAEDEAQARATAEYETSVERDRAVVAEQDALGQRDRAVEAEQEALVQASIGLASQSSLELEGSAPERSVLLALEALEHYPYTWQAERALSQAILKNRLRLVLDHDDFVQTAEWSNDGSKILTGAGDGIVRVWDTVSGEELLRIKEGTPNLAKWSPDERFILTVNEEDLTVKVWDINTRSERYTLDLENLGAGIEINRYEWEPWSPSGDRILMYFDDGTVRIWDADNGEVLQTLTGHQGWVSEALWSPGGDLIASSGWEDGKVIVWQVDSGNLLHTIPAGFESEEVFVGRWSPSGDRITVHGLGGAKVYDAVTGNQLLNLVVPNVWINRVIWSPDGTQILTSGKEDGVARVWDAENGREITQMTGFTQAQASDWSLSGDLVAVADIDGSVRVRDMAKDVEILDFSTAPTVFSVSFSPEGERLFAIGWDNSVKVYDLSEAFLRISLPAGVVSNVEWSPTGEYIAFSVGEDTVKVWDAFNGEEQFSLPDHMGNLSYVKWSPCEDRILTISDGDNLAKVWDARTGEQQLIFAGHENNTFAGGWSPDCSHIVTSDFGGDVIVWDSVTGDEIQILSGHQHWGWNAVWSPEGTRILSTDDHGKATIQDAATGEVLRDLFPKDYTLGIRAASWTKNGNRVVLQSVDGIVHIFDSRTGEDLKLITTPIWGMRLSVSPSEERLITGGAGGNAMVWDIETGEELISYDVGGWVDAAYSPDGERVLIGSTDGTLQIFPTWHSPQELIDYAYDCCVFRELTAEERTLFGLQER